MRTIKFDYKLAKTGKYNIVTRAGAPVRVICWDKDDGDFCIVALLRDEHGYEFVQSYHADGTCGDCGDWDLLLVANDEDDKHTWEDLTEFEYAVGNVLYNKYFIEKNNQDILKHIKRVAAKLYESAGKQFIQEQAFKDTNDSNFNEEFHDVIETALWKHWRKSKLSGVYGIRYTLQGSVIYDCVGGKEVDKNIVLDMVVDALNCKNLPAQPTFNGIYLDTTKPNNKRYVEEHTFKISESTEEDIIKKYISENIILGTVLKVLKDCGWCVIKQDEVTDIYDLAKSITERMQRNSNVKL